MDFMGEGGRVELPTSSCVQLVFCAVPRTLPSHPLIVGVGGGQWGAFGGCAALVLFPVCPPLVRADRMAEPRAWRACRWRVERQGQAQLGWCGGAGAAHRQAGDGTREESMWHLSSPVRFGEVRSQGPWSCGPSEQAAGRTSVAWAGRIAGASTGRMRARSRGGEQAGAWQDAKDTWFRVFRI